MEEELQTAKELMAMIECQIEAHQQYGQPLPLNGIKATLKQAQQQIDLVAELDDVYEEDEEFPVTPKQISKRSVTDRLQRAPTTISGGVRELSSGVSSQPRTVISKTTALSAT